MSDKSKVTITELKRQLASDKKYLKNCIVGGAEWAITANDIQNLERIIKERTR